MLLRLIIMAYVVSLLILGAYLRFAVERRMMKMIIIQFKVMGIIKDVLYAILYIVISPIIAAFIIVYLPKIIKEVKNA